MVKWKYYCSNRLKMNADKTQLLWLGTRQQLNKLSVKELQLLAVVKVGFKRWGNAFLIPLVNPTTE